MVTRRTILRGAFLLVACASSEGCAHRTQLAREWDEESPVEGTERVANGAARRVEISFDETDWTETGVLRGRVRRFAEGSRELVVESRRAWSVIPYEVFGATLGRIIVTPLYFAILGPITSGKIHDYEGDGSVGIGDRARFTLAMLNPFEALPIDPASGTEEEVVGTRRERRADSIELPGEESELELRLEGTKGTEVVRGRTDGGAFELDLSPVLPRLREGEVRAELEETTTGTVQPVETIDQRSVVAALWSGGYYERAVTDRAAREQAVNLFRAEAGRYGTPRERAVELYRRTIRLHRENEPSETAPPEPEEAPVLLSDAIKSGKVRPRIRGIDLRRVSLRLENLTAARLRVLVPAGTFFDCRSGAQDMVTTRDARLELPGARRASRTIELPAACAEMMERTPRGSDGFDLTQPADPRLARIAPYLGAVGPDVKQAAVWILTDDATLKEFGRYSRPSIGRAEVLEAIALFLEAGVDIEDRAIWGWYLGTR